MIETIGLVLLYLLCGIGVATVNDEANQPIPTPPIIYVVFTAFWPLMLCIIGIYGLCLLSKWMCKSS